MTETDSDHLALLELACLALLAPLALFPTPARFTARLAIPGLWLCRWLVTRHAARSYSVY